MVRLGILDFDSSHCVEFTRRLNGVGVSPDQFVGGARVVLGAPGASNMAPERAAQFTPLVKECGVEIADPEAVIAGSDAVLVLSLCGGAHRASSIPALTAGKPTFVDKPFALTIADAREILRLAEEHQALLQYASGMRFCDELLAVPASLTRWGAVHGAVTYGPAKHHPMNPGLFHYGIHAVEVLFTILGAGCESVSAASTAGADVVTGTWKDGRLGTVRGVRRGCTAYGAVIYCEHGVVPLSLSATNAYRNLLRALVRGFETATPLVPKDVIVEEVAFVLAALESERRGGRPVPLSEIDPALAC